MKVIEMLENIFKKRNKHSNPTLKKDLEKTSTTPVDLEERELEEERKHAEVINQKIALLDRQTVLDIEKRIRQEYDTEFEANPSNLEECYEDLEDIKDELIHDVLHGTKDEVLKVLEMRIIGKVFEEKLISIGSSLNAYYEWAKNDCEMYGELIDVKEDGNNHRIK